MVECFWLAPPPWQRLVDYSGGPPSKGWIAQIEEHWYGNPQVSGSSPGSVKFSLPIFKIILPNLSLEQNAKISKHYNPTFSLDFLKGMPFLNVLIRSCPWVFKMFEIVVSFLRKHCLGFHFPGSSCLPEQCPIHSQCSLEAEWRLYKPCPCVT